MACIHDSCRMRDCVDPSDDRTAWRSFCQTVIDGVHLFQGVTDSTMSHGEGWQFIQVGRYIERASATAMLLEVYQREVFADASRFR